MCDSKNAPNHLLLYSKYAKWWPLLSAPEEYAEDAADYQRIIEQYHGNKPQTLLELGSGGGNNAFYLKEHYELTLCDLSESMLAVSRELNPAGEHIQGDMRTVRLERQFDIVFIQDAIGYMRTEGDLKAAIQTAYLHCKPGGVALFIPDYTTETFRSATYHGGHDGKDASMRFLQWDHDPIPDDGQYQVDFAYLFRAPGTREPEVIGETHICGLFPKQRWFQWIQEAGFTASSEVIDTDELEPGMYRVFIGKK